MTLDSKSFFGLAAAIAGFIQYAPYMGDIVKGKTRPHAFSWFVWGLPCFIVFAAQFYEGGAAGSWATAVTGFLCTVVFVLALFYGERKITRLDWISLFTAIAAIGWWVAIKDPLGSVVLITVIDIIGFIPTIRKSVDKPHEETMSTYIVGALKWVLSLCAFSTISLTVWLYPVAMVVANGLFAIMLHMWRSSLVIKRN